METNSLLNSIRKPKNIDLLYLTMLNGLSMKTELTRAELHRIFRNYKNDIRVCVTSVSENGKYTLEISFKNYIVYLLNKTFRYYLPNQRLINITVDIADVERFL